ncbi:MAG: carbohydrate kinase family protein [Vicinamibacterales bacterium]
MTAPIPGSGSAACLPPLPGGPRQLDVVGFGEASVDLVLSLDAFPQPDGKQVAREQGRLPGGQVATAVRALGRLGWRAAFAGAVGDDDGGALVLAALAGDGVDVSVARRVPGVATRSAVILVDRGRGTRSVIEHRDPRLNLPADRLPVAAIRSARVLLVDATDPGAAADAARAARAAGVRVAVDVDEAAAGAEALVALADAVIASEGYVRAAGGRIDDGLARIAARHPQAAVVCVTLGRRGCQAVAAGRQVTVPAFDVPCVDSTGAGDVFRAGFLAAWLAAPPGQGPELEGVLRYACAAAALSCAGAGAQGALPTADGVRGLLDSGRVVIG